MISKTEARLMRLNLAAYLDSEPYIDILDKFVDKMFDDTEHLERWARSYDIYFEQITFPNLHHTRNKWIRFHKL
jgi:hypothetical protein